MKTLIGCFLLASLTLSFSAKADSWKIAELEERIEQLERQLDSYHQPKKVKGDASAWANYVASTPEAFKTTVKLPKYCTIRERNEGKCK